MVTLALIIFIGMLLVSTPIILLVAVVNCFGRRDWKGILYILLITGILFFTGMYWSICLDWIHEVQLWLDQYV